LRSVIATMYGTKVKGPRYLEMAEGYVTEIGLDADDEIIGYKFVQLGVMMDNITKGMDPAAALAKASGTYGRFAEAVKVINPRKG
ncbi:MAG: hypothetical protein ABFD59_02300, partial [Smithella sp.]